MAEFVRIWRRRHCVVDELEELLRTAEACAETERLAALTVQRLYRGANARSVISTQAAACRTIQRVFRGHQGRVKANLERAARAELEESSANHYYVTLIKRVFKGYYSRKYFHDFFARKAYIESIKKKSEELRNQLSGHMEAQIEKEQDRAEEQARAEFKKVTQNLHHLLSTASTPGVYNPPYAQDMIPTAFNVPVEEHLRTGVKDYIRTNGLRRVKPATYAARSRLSVQASSKYGVVEEEKRSTRHYGKLRHLSAEPFVAGSKPKPRPVEPGISIGVEYEEPWRLSRSVRELEHHPSQKAKRVDAKPFHTSVINNRLFEEYERGRSRKTKRRGKGGRKARTGGLNDGTMRSMTLASEHTAV